MEQKFKIFMVDDRPYLKVDENVNIGDKAIVTVGDLYPTLVECQNEDQIKIIQESKLSMTKRHKVVMTPDKMNLDEQTLSLLKGKEGSVVVEYNEGEIKIVEDL
jgi:hypothetical protein